ncbi:hypothetical protein Tco_0685565 [Tanacetum coccineum]
MSTPVFVDPDISTQADGAQSSRVPAPFPEDPYVAIRQASSPTPLLDSTPPSCHAEELENSNTSSARSMSSDSTAPLSPDHPLIHTSHTPTPTCASFHRRTAPMTMRAKPVMSPSHSTRVTEAMALSDLGFHKRYRSSYETPSSSSSPALLVRKRYRGTSELILDTDSEEDEIREEDTDEDEGHGLDDEDHGLDDEGHSVESVGLGLEGRRRLYLRGFGSVLEPERPEKVSALKQPTLTTWIGLEDGITYIDVPAYPPPAPPVQTPPSPEWSSGLLPVSPSPSTVPSLDEDQFIKIGAQLELYEGILYDHTQRLDGMQPTLFRSLELKQERTVVTFRALWRPVLALEAWAGHVDTRMADMS